MSSKHALYASTTHRQSACSTHQFQSRQALLDISALS